MRQYRAQLRKVTLKHDLDIRIQFTSRKPREILIETFSSRGIQTQSLLRPTQIIDIVMCKTEN